MNILQVIGGLNVGGAETFIFNIFKNIDRNKFKFIFLCYGNKKFDYEDDIIKLGGNIVKISVPSQIGYIKHIKEIINVIKKYNVDVVHAHTLFNSCFAIIAAKICKVKKIIVHSHSTKNGKVNSLANKVYCDVSKFLINIFATDFVACGKEAGEFLYYKNKKVIIINNGIEINRFLFSQELRDKLREEYNIDKNDKVLMHVGRFCEVKNHNYLIEIFNEYLKIDNNARLFLIGKGPLENKIKEKVSRLNISDKVVFLGLKKNVNEFYNMADVFVFPSYFEGIPVVLYETQANGLPALISNKIDKQTKINNLIYFENIEIQPKIWAKKIFGLSRKNNKTNINIYDTVLNVKNTVKKLEKIYSKN